MQLCAAQHACLMRLGYLFEFLKMLPLLSKKKGVEASHASESTFAPQFVHELLQVKVEQMHLRMPSRPSRLNKQQ